MIAWVSLVIPAGFPSKHYFDGVPKAGIPGRKVTARLPGTPAFAGVTS